MQTPTQPSLWDHAGGHVGLHGDALWPTASSLAGKRARGPDANDMDFIEDDEVGGDGDWRTMLRARHRRLRPVQVRFQMLPSGLSSCGMSMRQSVLGIHRQLQCTMATSIVSSADSIYKPRLRIWSVTKRRYTLTAASHGATRLDRCLCAPPRLSLRTRADRVVAACSRGQGLGAPAWRVLLGCPFQLTRKSHCS